MILADDDEEAQSRERLYLEAQADEREAIASWLIERDPHVSMRELANLIKARAHYRGGK